MNEMAYIVAGETGEYSDRSAWFVRAFLNKAGAEALSDRLNKWCVEHGWAEGNAGWHEFEWDKRPKPPEDAHFNLDYTGTRYSVVEVPLDKVDQIPVAKAESED